MWIPVAVFLAGVACIIVAAATGEAEVQLFIIFPLISGSSLLFLLGVFLIVASFVLGFVLAASSMTEEEPVARVRSDDQAAQSQEMPKKRTSYGGVVLIGPVPIIFGSDRRMAMVMLILAIALIAIVLALALIRV